ncbi:MAG: hypothetical protein OFPII_40680 [Osedax symbiont Rs1]|nr:MAG: hypothetical protein OFPII_40680 [Osedax symbiont Rs1]
MADILVDDNLTIGSLLECVAIDGLQLAAAETIHSQSGVQSQLVVAQPRMHS